MPKADRSVYQPGGTHTRAIVGFHTDNGFDGIVRGGDRNFGKIIGISTQKAFGGAAGSFTITVKKEQQSLGPRSFLRLWPDPEDVWVTVKFVCDGQVIDTMFGVIDTVQEATVRTGGGARAEGYTISGRDFGKAFEETELFVDLVGAPGVRAAVGLADALKQFPGGTPADYVRLLTDLWVGNNAMAEKQWELPQSLGGSSLYNILNLTTIQPMTPGNGFIHDPALFNPDQGGRKLWETMQEYANGLLNELWVDLAPAPGDLTNIREMTPAVYLRERPFKIRESSRKWDSIRIRTLEKGDIQQRHITKGGGANRFNYWAVDFGGFTGDGYEMRSALASLGFEAFKPGSIPIVNNESIRKHGLRRWQQGTLYLPINDREERGGWIIVAANWLKRVHDWHSVAPMQYTGTLVTSRVMPEIRIGERVREKRDEGNIIYYVEGISHDWQYPGAGQSTITVTHGEYEDENLLDEIYRQYDQPQTVQVEDCTIDPAADPNEPITDDVLAQIARGCRFRVVTGEATGADRDATDSITPGVTTYEFFGANPEDQLSGGGSLVGEGAPALSGEAQGDPGMIPLDDVLNNQATRAASGEPVPPVPTEAQQQGREADAADEPLSLTQEALERGDDISVPLDDPNGINANDDPILGIDEIGP